MFSNLIERAGILQNNVGAPKSVYRPSTAIRHLTLIHFDESSDAKRRNDIRQPTEIYRYQPTCGSFNLYFVPRDYVS